jgi:hypothetical protein
MRKTATALVVAGAAAATAVWRRRQERRREHVDLYFADGSMISLAEGTDEAARLLPLARDVLTAARQG